MKLTEVTACFPEIADWEDSYLSETKRQRLLGEAEDYQVEIFLDGQINEIAIFFAIANISLVRCIALVSGSQESALSFLEAASVSLEHDPNTPFRKTFPEHEIELTRIRAEQTGASVLKIRPKPRQTPPAQT